MTLEAIATSALFLCSVLALGSASLRLVSPITPTGLQRVLSVSVVMATVAVLQSLVLGRVSLGANPVALGSVSILLGIGGRYFLPAPEASVSGEVRAWWTSLTPAWRVAAGAGAGIFVTWSVWGLLEPSLDVDSAQYHLPETAAWIATGTPGSHQAIVDLFPVTSYPITNEVLLSLVGGLSRNMAPVLLWSPVCAALLLAAFAAGAREVGAKRIATVAAAIALFTVPIVSDAMTSVGTDLPATTWVVVCIALCLSVARSSPRSDPRALAFAVLAFGLAIGTKTNVAPLGLIALAGTVWVTRRRLPQISLLIAASVAAAATGGVWYIRNFIEHGSPLWPFVELPIGDPIPTVFRATGTRFISHPIGTLDGKLGDYIHNLGAAPLLMMVAILVMLPIRDRRVVIGAITVGVGVLIWTIAPFTGDSGGFAGALLALSTTRYLMPTVACAAGVLALVASMPSSPAVWIARCALMASSAFGVIAVAVGRDGTPALLILITAALVGGGIGLLRISFPPLPSRPRMLFASMGAALALALAIYPGAFLERFSRSSSAIEDPLDDTRATFGELAGWFNDQPSYRDSSRPVSFDPKFIGPLAGGGFEHPTSLVPGGTGCGGAMAAMKAGWLVLNIPTAGTFPPPAAAACVEGLTPLATFPTTTGELQVFSDLG